MSESTVACRSESSSPLISAHLRHQRGCKDEIQDLAETAGRAPAAARRSPVMIFALRRHRGDRFGVFTSVSGRQLLADSR